MGLTHGHEDRRLDPSDIDALVRLSLRGDLRDNLIQPDDTSTAVVNT